MGREEEAYEKHVEAYNIGEKLYGPLSPRVFTSLYKKAWYTARRGDLLEAMLVRPLLSSIFLTYNIMRLSLMIIHTVD